MKTLDILRAEHGTIRVFAISRPIREMALALRQSGKRELACDMIGHDLTEDSFELFALSDLAGVGLHGYLSEGYDVDRDALRADRTRLDALDGYVLLVFSRISAQGDVRLTLKDDLTLIGTYAEPQASHSAAPIKADAAKPYSGVTAKATAPRRSRIGSVFTAGAAALILLVIWWILR